MESRIWSRQITQDGKWGMTITTLFFPIVAIIFSLTVGLTLAIFGSFSWAVIIGTLTMILMIFLCYYELAVTIIIAIHLYVDYYLGLYLLAGLVAIVLLVIFLLMQPNRFLFTKPRALWLWFLLLLIALLPTIRNISLADGFNYYFNDICCALIFLFLGTIIGNHITNVRRLLMFLSCFGTFIAFVSIVQDKTGNLIFYTSKYDASLALSNDFALFSGYNVQRVGAYFVHPNSNGGFISMMICLSLGLFVNSDSIRWKLFYFMEMCILLPALLFTYSTESWIALGVGVLAFFVLVGRNDYRILIISLVVIVTICMNFLFPAQLTLLQMHATAPIEVQMRQAAWQTGIAVVRAFPLTGLSLGRHVYLVLSNPYRVPAQYEPLDHPHNAFLELTALGGVPVGIIFTSLLFFTFFLAFSNWTLADKQSRSIIGASIAATIALTSFSMSDAGWTLPPLLAIGWLILGLVSSPALRKSLRSESLAREES